MPDRDLTVNAVPGFPPAWGTALWMLEDTRRRTLDAVRGITDREVDQVPAGFDNSIGSLLYHLAAIEVDWLYSDILQVPFPAWTEEQFPFEVRGESGHLTPVAGLTTDDHLLRLAAVREHLFEDLAELTDDDFHRERRIESGFTTPEWVFHHLRQHESEHRGQIQSLLTALRS